MASIAASMAAEFTKKLAQEAGKKAIKEGKELAEEAANKALKKAKDVGKEALQQGKEALQQGKEDKKKLVDNSVVVEPSEEEVVKEEKVKEGKKEVDGKEKEEEDNKGVVDQIDNSVVVEPSEEEVEKEEKVELKASLDDALKRIPFVGEIIDENPIAGHAITLFTSVFPGYSERLTKFLSDEDNKAAINGILSEMSKPEFMNYPTKQAEIFSTQFGKQLQLNKTELAQFTPDAIMNNVNTMKDEIKTTLSKNSASSTNVVKSDLPGQPNIEHTDNGKTTVIFTIPAGGKSKTKKTKKSKSKSNKSKKTNKTKSNKSKKTNKTKSIKRRRTHKKKSKK